VLEAHFCKQIPGPSCDNAKGDEDSNYSKEHNCHEVAKKLLLLHLKPGIENDRREKIDKEELLIELQNVRISTLACQQHNYSTTKPLYRQCIHITPCM
jgi:hypothetical protein